MHEFTLMADILRQIDAVAEEHGADKVLKVKIKLGALSHISAEHFREHFESGARGTAAEGAVLEVEELTDVKDARAQSIILDTVELPG